MVCPDCTSDYVLWSLAFITSVCIHCQILLHLKWWRWLRIVYCSYKKSLPPGLNIRLLKYQLDFYRVTNRSHPSTVEAKPFFLLCPATLGIRASSLLYIWRWPLWINPSAKLVGSTFNIQPTVWHLSPSWSGPPGFREEVSPSSPCSISPTLSTPFMTKPVHVTSLLKNPPGTLPHSDPTAAREAHRVCPLLALLASSPARLSCVGPSYLFALPEMCHTCSYLCSLQMLFLAEGAVPSKYHTLTRLLRALLRGTVSACRMWNTSPLQPRNILSPFSCFSPQPFLCLTYLFVLLSFPFFPPTPAGKASQKWKRCLIHC